jgi:glycosyltransferase involved in cell wall biosynthesis
MIRLLLLEASLGVGGGERTNQRLLLGLDRARFDPHVVTLKDAGVIGRELAAAGVPVVDNLSTGRLNVPRAWSALKKHMREVRPDLVLTTDSPQALLYSGWLKRRGHIPALCAVCTSTEPENRGLRRKLAWRVAGPVADRVVAKGADHTEYVHAEWRIPRNKLVNILNGVDLGRFQPPVSKDKYKEALGWSPEDLLVGIVAALRPEKNHAMFVGAATRLRSQFPRARFLIVGDGPERERIESLIRQKGVGETVRLLGLRSDIPDVLAALDVAVLTSRPIVEALPTCLIEADAMALPVVATRVGSVSDIVEDGVTGYVVRAGDLDGFTERLGQLLADPHLRREFGAAARERALRLFPVENMVRNYERLFTEIVEAAPA